MAQASHPCLWCNGSQCQIKRAPSQQPEIPKRTVKGIRRDHKNFKRNGGDKKKAKAYNNVAHQPIFNIDLAQVVPPYLHVLLGIVKKHHDYLEQECHEIDKNIADSLAKSGDYENKTPFGEYVNSQKTAQKYEEKKNYYEAKLERMEKDRDSYYRNTFEEKKEKVQDKIRHYTEQAKAVKNKLKLHDGPVISHLDAVLTENKITPEAYHGGALVGNHCNRYLRPDVTEKIGAAVLRKTYELVDDHNIHNKAHDTAEKFKQLNTYYGELHRRISHTLAVTDDDVDQAKVCINRYMAFYRQQFGEHCVIPKQHFLETHCVEFLRKWKVGLGLLGEQGGEEMHAFINSLKDRVRGINNKEQKLRVLMKEQHTIVSPLLRFALEGPAKKT